MESNIRNNVSDITYMSESFDCAQDGSKDGERSRTTYPAPFIYSCILVLFKYLRKGGVQFTDGLCPTIYIANVP
jgi:hypothetical protein